MAGVDVKHPLWIAALDASIGRGKRAYADRLGKGRSPRLAGEAPAIGTPKVQIDFPLIYMGLRRADRKVCAWCQPIQIIAATNSMTATGFS
jgi:hypothetical protein